MAVSELVCLFVCLSIMAMHPVGKGRYCALAIYISLLSTLFISEANYSVMCASACLELATVLDMRTCDGVAYMPMPALPLRTDASTYISTCPGLCSSVTAFAWSPSSSILTSDLATHGAQVYAFTSLTRSTYISWTNSARSWFQRWKRVG
ncbi:hypothetical protein CC78DRAFT_285167 [Lojkania enalia]|uniref:Secreted protein n=1 Tax=Lojkania enalia TaxID=147567 RepID=A0A9P4K8K0_9PLEO|nr:hypothetical protein CC78DRAFT_285167 [Didymosphaeria enalia]